MAASILQRAIHGCVDVPAQTSPFVDITLFSWLHTSVLAGNWPPIMDAGVSNFGTLAYAYMMLQAVAFNAETGLHHQHIIIRNTDACKALEPHTPSIDASRMKRLLTGCHRRPH